MLRHPVHAVLEVPPLAEFAPGEARGSHWAVIQQAVVLVLRDLDDATRDVPPDDLWLLRGGEDEVAQLTAQPPQASGEGGLLASFQRCARWGKDPGQVSNEAIFVLHPERVVALLVVKGDLELDTEAAQNGLETPYDRSRLRVVHQPVVLRVLGQVVDQQVDESVRSLFVTAGGRSGAKLVDGRAIQPRV